MKSKHFAIAVLFLALLFALVSDAYPVGSNDDVPFSGVSDAHAGASSCRMPLPRRFHRIAVERVKAFAKSIANKTKEAWKRSKQRLLALYSKVKDLLTPGWQWLATRSTTPEKWDGHGDDRTIEMVDIAPSGVSKVVEWVHAVSSDGTRELGIVSSISHDGQHPGLDSALELVMTRPSNNHATFGEAVDRLIHLMADQLSCETFRLLFGDVYQAAVKELAEVLHSITISMPFTKAMRQVWNRVEAREAQSVFCHDTYGRFLGQVYHPIIQRLVRLKDSIDLLDARGLPVVKEWIIMLCSMTRPVTIGYLVDSHPDLKNILSKVNEFGQAFLPDDTWRYLETFVASATAIPALDDDALSGLQYQKNMNIKDGLEPKPPVLAMTALLSKMLHAVLSSKVVGCIIEIAAQRASAHHEGNLDAQMITNVHQTLLRVTGQLPTMIKRHEHSIVRALMEIPPASSSSFAVITVIKQALFDEDTDWVAQLVAFAELTGSDAGQLAFSQHDALIGASASWGANVPAVVQFTQLGLNELLNVMVRVSLPLYVWILPFRMLNRIQRAATPD
ncbi:hypothetical protein SeLEV6574_g01442 [Synchytrium endobioticum]|uniref:Uncharacterized protein n=1 Tax=Synchytrium endobioticum TaxID=286115 RepID=A0A507DF27_9FUNG|nr:hypothetical protein SeLEV6574_g01442 [Synchytrium endobioticum]